MSLLTKDYDYILPQELIASTPVYPRSNSKLLIYKRETKEIIHTNFFEILKYIPKNTSIIVNNTKVLKARVYGKKQSGGIVEVLLVKPLEDYNFLVNIRGKVKQKTLIFFDKNLTCEVLELLEDGSRVVVFYKDGLKVAFKELVEILSIIGHIPLPPYIKREDTIEDEKSYQSVFAKEFGSVAAPTASLHFTPELFAELKNSFNLNEVTLHVGMGTYKGVECDNILDHKIHSEYFNISQKTAQIIDTNSKVLTIGTTSTRTIEYYFRTKKTFGECDLFLNPNNKPQRVDYILTNFHLPKSTLIMLVASFISLDEVKKIYDEAIKNRYRFFSYGDAMLII